MPFESTSRLRGWMRWLPARNQGSGPPDMNEIWRDFNRKLSGLFGGGTGRPPSSGGEGGDSGPSARGAGIGAGLIAAVVLLGWLSSGFFIVQESEQGVITTFGKYSRTVGPGFQWRLPYPFQSSQVVKMTELQTVEIGSRSGVMASTGLRDSSMLTQDENIVDIRFTVQFRLKDARDYLFENADPSDAVRQAAESSVREIVGRSTMDSVLYEQRDAIATEIAKSVQTQLDRLKAGIQVANVNVQNVQAPEQVQAAFDDAVKAGADRERLKNEGEAYANQVVPQAQGQAARLREEAEGYRARIVSTAEGDAQRFRSVLAEYQKAPAVTRDRMYIDAMHEVYSRVTKVLVDSKSGSNLLYLPLDKLVQSAAVQPQSSVTPAAAGTGEAAPASPAQSPAAAPRELMRSRDR